MTNEVLFWKKVECLGRGYCWPWLGYRKKSGHGLTSNGRGNLIHAHRKAWLFKRGPIADGLCVLHKCGNAACCNPEHMYLGTRADNMRDRFGKNKYRVRKTTINLDSKPLVSEGILPADDALKNAAKVL